MNKSTAFMGLLTVASISGLTGYVTYLSHKSSERERQDRIVKDERDRQDRIRREQNAHDEKMELYKGMSPEQKSELMKQELEVDREKAKSKERLVEMSNDLEARIAAAIDKKYADKFEKLDTSLYACQKALKSSSTNDNVIRFTLG